MDVVPVVPTVPDIHINDPPSITDARNNNDALVVGAILLALLCVLMSVGYACMRLL